MLVAFKRKKLVVLGVQDIQISNGITTLYFSQESSENQIEINDIPHVVEDSSAMSDERYLQELVDYYSRQNYTITGIDRTLPY